MCTTRIALACCWPSNAMLHDFLVEKLQETGLQSKVSLSVLKVATFDEYLQKQGQLDAGPGIALCDVLLTDPFVLSASMNRLQAGACNLRWAQLTWAGLDPLVSTVAKLEKPISFAVTRLASNFGQHMAEYVVGHIIARERGFVQQHLNQLGKKWSAREYEKFYNYRLLSSLTIGIVGAGTIGKEVARVCKTLGMRVCGLTREPVSAKNTCPHIDQYKLSEELSELLEMSDYVCSILPETPETKGLLSGDVLRHCATKKSVLINVGRGTVVDEDSIVRAVKQGWIGGAILDVFTTEPLSQDSPLWSLPTVTITPHCAAASKPIEVVNVFVDNLRSFLLGEQLRNQVDFSKGY